MASPTALTRSLTVLLAFLLLCQVLVPLVAADPVPEPKKPKGSSSTKNTTSDDESMAAFGAASPDALNVIGMSFLAFLASRFL